MITEDAQAPQIPLPTSPAEVPGPAPGTAMTTPSGRAAGSATGSLMPAGSVILNWYFVPSAGVNV